MHIAHQNDAKSLFMKTVALDFAKKVKKKTFFELSIWGIFRENQNKKKIKKIRPKEVSLKRRWKFSKFNLNLPLFFEARASRFLAASPDSREVFYVRTNEINYNCFLIKYPDSRDSIGDTAAVKDCFGKTLGPIS